ncbi:NYN domain-containing protein [candidate division CSSED10-310 bacterium]|uniref:NYN domain-containing protein n=1 Tax=candidate division CSSED10-310 bacterium TaxID=2855610 RepID=A0ABV6YXV3_UNCC1
MTSSVSSQQSEKEQKSGPKVPKRNTPSISYSALKHKVQKLERDLVQARKREKITTDKLKRALSSERKLQSELSFLKKKNLKKEEQLDKLTHNYKVSIKDLNQSKIKLAAAMEKGSKCDQFRKLWEDEKRKREVAQTRLHDFMEFSEDKDLHNLLNRMDEFIEGGIKEREEQIRYLDRTRDRAVQSIRILEKEKAINLGLLKTKTVNRKIGERLGVFVDVQNMFYAARQQFSGRLDFQRLLNLAANERRLHKAVAYIIQTPDIDQTNFISLLTHCGYEVKSKDLRTRLDGSAKGNWDMEMAMDIISFLPKIDVVILVSGDGDFVPLVQKIKNEYNIRCEVFGFEHNTAVDLKEVADVFHPIGKDMILDSVNDRGNDHNSTA